VVILPLGRNILTVTVVVRVGFVTFALVVVSWTMTSATTSVPADSIYAVMSPQLDRAPTSIPLLGMMIDRTSFDETDDFGVNQDVKAQTESYIASPPVVMKDGKVRRRLRWRPKGMAKRKRIPPPPPPSRMIPPVKVNHAHSSSASVASQASRHSKKSMHSFASTETACINNTSTHHQRRQAVSKYPPSLSGRPERPLSSHATIGNEGDFVEARIHRTDPSNTTIFAAADTQSLASSNHKKVVGFSSGSTHREANPKDVVDGVRKLSIDSNITSSARRPGLPPLFQRPSIASTNVHKPSRSNQKNSGSPNSTPSTSTRSLSDSNSSIDSSIDSSDTNLSGNNHSISTASHIPVPVLSGDEVETERRVDLRIRKASHSANCVVQQLDEEEGVEPLSVYELQLDEVRSDISKGTPSRWNIKQMDSGGSRKQKQIAGSARPTNFSWTSSLSSSNSDELRFSMSSNGSTNPIVGNGRRRKSKDPITVLSPSSNSEVSVIEITPKVRTCPVDVDDGTFLEAEKNLQAIHEMASEHLRQGEYAEALEVFEEILRGQLARFGENHYRVGTALHNIGIVHMRRGDYTRALSVYKEAVRVRKIALDPFHPDIGASLAQLGVAYMEKDKHRKAIGAFREALKIRRTCLGNDHPKVAKILNNIGCSLFELDELEVAMVAFEEALDIQRNLLRYPADEHPVSESSLLSIASTQSNIASIKLYCGNFDEALVDLEEALLIQQCALGDDHPLARRTQESIRWMETARPRDETPPAAVDLLTQLTSDSIFSTVSSSKSPPKKRVLSSNMFDALLARLDVACGGNGWDPIGADDASYGDTVSDRSSYP
jgi:tetratricopeptide (TPR) repeat protein